MMKSSIFTLFLLCVVFNATAQISVTFNENGTFTVPAGVTEITVQCWGAGGVPSGLNGSGGGAFAQSKPIAVTAGQTYLVNVATQGGLSSFIKLSPSGLPLVSALSAVGQQGGVATIANSNNSIAFSYSGGNGGNGIINNQGTDNESTLGGGGGGAAGSDGNGQNGQLPYGGVPGLGGGAGADGGSVSGTGSITGGKSGDAPGGGAGGVDDGFSQITGANGRIIVTYCFRSNMKVLAQNQNRVEIAKGDYSPSVADFTDFGNVGTLGLSKTGNFYINNPSPNPLVINDITIGGTNAAEFALIVPDPLPITIPGGEGAGFAIRFTPTSTVVKSARITLFTDDCVGEYDFDVKGNGIVPANNVYNGSGTFLVPAGVTELIVQCWGAGGVPSGNNGSGGGAFAQSKPIAVSAGQFYQASVGFPPSYATSFNTIPGNVVVALAYAANGQQGGAATPISTGWAAISYSGGNGGNGSVNFRTGGGGGGAGGLNSSGLNGNNAGISSGEGGGAGSGGGAGGLGGQNFAVTVFGQKGFAPGGGGGGVGDGVANQGGDGRVIVNYVCPDAGTIGNGHSIPYPPQQLNDFVISVSGPVPTTQNGLVYTWQQSTDNINWEATKKNAGNSLRYRFDNDSLQKTTYYRRVSNTCADNKISNVVAIHVVKPINGAISGKVVSKNGTGVKGIKVYAQKVSALPGSPVSWIDSTETVDDGTYSIQQIYYGDPNEAGNLNFVSTAFVVRPFKLNHGFIQPSLTRSLTSNIPQISGVDFTDTTVYAINGKIYQECEGCLNGSNVATTITSPLDSVEMYNDNFFITKSGLIDPHGEFGRYSVTVTDPATYKIEPRFRNHTFSPAFKNVPVENDVDNVDFKDVTTYTISGKLTAGCGDYIGTATLEFFDVLPNDKAGNPRTSIFRKRVSTNPDSGTYSITLPARKWQVKVVSFSKRNGGDVESPKLLEFFEVKVPKDSLIRDISNSNATLNLVYNRQPTLDMVGLDTVCNKPYAIIEQSKEKTFTIRAFQGASIKNCPATDANLVINTNIQNDDDNETINIKTINGQAVVKLMGGVPNIVVPYYKTLNIQFKDVNGFNAELNRNVVVTGLKSNTGTFTTVSPQLPLMVLHDPPGDNSFSFWEAGVTNEIAIRTYYARDSSNTGWFEGKKGVKKEVGLGVSIETAYWGSLNYAHTVGGRINDAREDIVSVTTTQSFSTASNDAVVGAQGDVFIGAAMNLLYSVTNELAFNPDSCTLGLSKKLMLAQNGFATQYTYSEDHIRNTLLPTLRTFRDNPGNTKERTDSFSNQIKVWEQTLANNDVNKKNAAFDKNISFDGSVGPITSTTTSDSSRSNTIEFDMFIDGAVAIELGIEIGGSGFKGGFMHGFKMESGNSTTSTKLQSTTIGYTLDDDDGGDYYSVNIKKDPVYKTPVFETVAATTSCPFEPGTQPRDEMQLIVPQPVKTNVDPNGEAEFTLKISNTSQSEERRTYNLSFIQASNPNGAVITIGGSPVLVPIAYTIDYLGEINVLVKVKRGAANIFSYEGLQFIVTDACDGSIAKTARISAFFEPACSNIELSQPENNWVNSSTNNNILPILFRGYMPLGTTTSVTLEYQFTGSNNWITGFTIPVNNINNSVNGNLINWNITSLKDGVYNLRLKLNCASGVVYSARSAGIIDRTAPQLLGKPEPTDDNYVVGDQISVRYTEAIGVNNISEQNVKLIRLSNQQQLSASITGYANQLVISPASSITGFTNETFRVIVQNIQDVYGNSRAKTDSFTFTVGKTIIDTGSKAVTTSIRNPNIAENIGARSGFKVINDFFGGNSILSAGDTTISVYFNLKKSQPIETRVNFSIGGTAVYLRDYKVSFDSVANSFTNTFDGTLGSISIPKGETRSILRIDPINNLVIPSDKTVIISILEGGDYGLGQNPTVSGSIINVNAISRYEFTGTGNFSVTGNWLNELKPPSSLPAGYEIIINPTSGECLLDVPLTIMPGAKLTVAPGKAFNVRGALNIKK